MGNKKLTKWGKRMLFFIPISLFLLIGGIITNNIIYKYGGIAFLSWSITALIYELNISQHLPLFNLNAEKGNKTK